MKTQKFSPVEQRLLKRRMQQHGAKKDCTDKTGIGIAVIKQAMHTGNISALAVNSLRRYISNNCSRLFIESAA